MDEIRFQVHGVITDEAGQEVSHAAVTVFQQRIRDRRPLVEGRADEDGRYHVAYEPPEHVPGRLMVVVRASAQRLKEGIESPLIAATSDLEVNLSRSPSDMSEFSVLERDVLSLLDGLSLDDLMESAEHQDITFLALDTNRGKEAITRLVVAARLESAYRIQAATFYAFLSQRVPSAIPSPLLPATQGWELIDGLVNRLAGLVFALTPDVQKQTLQRAVDTKTIPAISPDQIDEIVTQLQARRVVNTLDAPYQVGKASLGELLNVAKLPAQKQQAFASALTINTGSMRNFWRKLADPGSGFTPEEASAIQRSLEIGSFTKNHLPLVSALAERFTAGQYTSTADLARLSLSQWNDLVAQVGPPANVNGAGALSAAEVYAKVIYTRVTRAYPTVALSTRLADSGVIPADERDAVVRFFANNTKLELVKANLTTYVENAGEEAFAGIDAKQRPAVVDRAKQFQRVLRVAPNVDTAETLLRSGVGSAAEIATMGRQQFFAKAVELGLNKREANRVFNAGAQRYADAVSLYTQLNRSAIGDWPRYVGSTTDLEEPTAQAVKRDQSLATLFGSQDYCATEDCTSILSPAAYLCDLLLWLRNHPLSGPYANALLALRARRPDLENLLLNCPNTDVALPYIDLVNELLEDAVAPPALPVWRQTTLTAPQLRAAPEYVNADAYTTLAAASYPHTLPYDKALDELRTGLGQSGIVLWQLREQLLPLHAPTLLQKVGVAAARFEIDVHETDLICTPNDVTAQVAWNTANPGVDLAAVPAFLAAADITYEQLLEMLEVVWVRGGGAALTLQGVDDTCDLSLQSLAPAPIDTAVLDRLHRFLRMWRHAPWTMWELDLLLSAPTIGAGTLDQNALTQLAAFRRLQEAARLDVDELLALFGNVDLVRHRDPSGDLTTSLYSRLFLDPSVPADADLVAVGSGTAVADPVLANHVASIRAALQVSADEATILMGFTDGTLTLANLSKMLRIATLASTTRLTIEDFVRLLSLSGPGTADAALTAVVSDAGATLEFIQDVRDIKQSGFSIDELSYVLTQQPATVGLTTDQITTVVMPAVRTAMQATHDEIFTSADPALTVLQRELAQLPQFSDAATLATMVSIVDDSYSGNLAARNAFIAANVAQFMDVPTAQADLAPLPGGLTHAQRQAAVTQRAQQVLNPLAVYLTQTRVIAALAGATGLQPAVTSLLVRQVDTPATSTIMLSTLTDASIIAKSGGAYTPITQVNFPAQYAAIGLLDKIGTVVRRLHLVPTDLEWLLSNAPAYGGLDLRLLPVLPAQVALSYPPLLTTSLLVKLDRSLSFAPAGAPYPDLYSVITGVSTGAIATAATAQAALASISGWAATDIGLLATTIGAVFPADYTRPSTYDTLRTLEAMMTASGGNATQLITWGTVAPAPTAAADSAMSVLKSRYGESDWLQVAPTLVDPMRERRSAALQAFLLAQRDGVGALIFGDTNALFEHFLIDVQMSSCQVTTRVIQAYAAVQLFVERALMALEEPDVVVDPTRDDTWSQWRWMKRFRIWQAAREVFLYPENWLVESQRPNRTEIFQKLEQEVHQNDSTADYLETVALNYIDRLDEVAHLTVTGSCTDPHTGAIHVVARTIADPPKFYHRTFADRTWSGWQLIPVDIKAHQAVPAVFRRRLCIFWADVKVVGEPHQDVPAAQASTSAPPDPAKYVSIGLNFTVFRNSAWSPQQRSRGRLFDLPILTSQTVSNSAAVEALYTLKVQTPAPAPGYGAALSIDLFRLGDYDVRGVTFFSSFTVYYPDLDRPDAAVHVGRATFDGRFSDLEQRNLDIVIGISKEHLLDHAQAAYGPDALPLLELPAAQSDPNLVPEPGPLVPQAGALSSAPPHTSGSLPLVFTSTSSLQQNNGPLLTTAQVPFRVVGDDSDIAFDPGSHFFYQDNRRGYFVESVKYYQWGSAWLPNPPSYASTAPFEQRYAFHRFYHPYARLIWHQLSGGGFPALYDRNLQLSPDTVDPSGADQFSFRHTYNPVSPQVSWGEDNEIIDFAPDAAYSVYNWELFFHTPLYIAERLSQNQQFEDALAWFHFLFDPTRSGTEPVPQRFWITKPLNSLTTTAILAERINNLLLAVDHGDANAVAQVARWRRDPFNPFLIADQRPVAYMKRVVMSYLDNLIAWADNLFATDSREALNEATLLYVIAAEILGPQPVAVTPAQHVDESYHDLEPKLDAFANAMVAIENVVPMGGGGGGGGDGGLPVPQTFYFAIPPNDKLLGYWTTVADRLFKLRHCQNIQGVTRALALFDAPIDPGLLVRAQSAGVDIGSVLSDLSAPRPGYRFATLYAQALEFSSAVQQYGAKLLAALERSDAEALSMLLTVQRQQMAADLDQILQSRVDETQHQIDALQHAIALAQAKYDDAHDHPFVNAAEAVYLGVKGSVILANIVSGVIHAIAGGLALLPDFALGVAGFGGSPAADAKEGGSNANEAAKGAAEQGKALADSLSNAADLSKSIGDYIERADDNAEKAKEADIEKNAAQAKLAAAQVRLAIAQAEQVNHQAEETRIQDQIDFLGHKFTAQDLYDWMVGRLSDTYFQAYRLAYKMGKQAEQSYRYELGFTDSSFVQFGYWDSLKKGLLAGESLAHDLRRMQASYLEQNSRRYEITRNVSLAAVNPQALVKLIQTGTCDIDLPESLFDGDYPGHYQRRLQRLAVTVEYPATHPNDNVRCTVTLTKNSVRMTADLSTGYQRQAGTDPRFIDEFGVVPQKIALGSGQADPGLFLSAMTDNLADPRYLPFEGAGAVSSWRIDMPSVNNDVNLATVTDVVLHLSYTALDGGDSFRQAVDADLAANLPTSGAVLLSASAGFEPDTWSRFLAGPGGGGDQVLTLNVAPNLFPRWTRGKTITVTAMAVLATSTHAGSFVIRPQAPLPTTQVVLNPVAGVTEPNVTSGNVAVANAAPGTWSFKVRTAGAGDFRSLTTDDIDDVLLLMTFQVS